MKASQVGYSRREMSVLVDKIQEAMTTWQQMIWVNWVGDTTIELVSRKNRKCAARFETDEIFAETTDNARPFTVQADFRKRADKALRAKIAEVNAK